MASARTPLNALMMRSTFLYRSTRPTVSTICGPDGRSGPRVAAGLGSVPLGITRTFSRQAGKVGRHQVALGLLTRR